MDANVNMLIRTTNSPDDALQDNHQMCRIPTQTTRLYHTRATALDRWLGVDLVRIDNHRNFVARRSSMTWRGLVKILHGKPFYVYTAHFTAKPVSLPTFMIIAIA